MEFGHSKKLSATVIPIDSIQTAQAFTKGAIPEALIKTQIVPTPKPEAFKAGTQEKWKASFMRRHSSEANLSSGQICVFDTEDDSKGNAFLACAVRRVNGEIERTAFHGEGWELSIIHWMIDNNIRLAYAVNLEYDVNNIFRASKALTRVYVGGRLLYAELNSIEFRDLAWYENPPISVKRMGEQIAMPKLQMPNRALATAEMIEYCMADCEIALRWLELVQKDFSDIGVTLKRTLPSTAMGYFKSISGRLPNHPELNIWRKDIHDYLRQSYFGGRTEVYRIGPVSGNIHCADVSSMYPGVMAERDYPDPETAEIVPASRCDITEPGVYDCQVNAPRIRFPVLGLRHDNLTVFPSGSFSGVWTGAELVAAQKRGYCIRPKIGVRYRATCNPFRQFVSALYEWKAKGHTRAKFIMNSLYGKFGESGELTVIGPKGTEIIKSRPRHANVVWSAYITAYARLKLLEGIERVESIGGESLYCDTDSCFYDCPLTYLDEGSKLGDWTDKGCKDMFEAKCPKVYRWGDTYHGKGVPRAEAMGFFLTGMATYKKPNRFRESLRRGLGINVWDDNTKHSAFKYRKRIVLSDGATIPLCLSL